MNKVQFKTSNIDVCNIFYRLEEFQRFNSFAGSVSFFLWCDWAHNGGKWVEKLWEPVCMNTVKHMLNGHAFSRCIRAYTITAVALFSLKNWLQRSLLRVLSCGGMLKNNIFGWWCCYYSTCIQPGSSFWTNKELNWNR